MTTLTRVSAAAAMAAALIAGPALADQGGTPNGGNGTDNPHAAQPAQPAEPTVQPATPAEPAEQTEAKTQGSSGSKPAKAAKPAKPATKPAKPAKPAKAKSQGSKAKSAPAPAKAKTNTHAKAGKTTICHATGSETNPYVTITVSNNAIPAHDRHQNDEDIIPAPAGGCPGGSTDEGGSVKPSGDGEKNKDKAGKTTICHATGSETNPFVKITISDNAVEAHARHQDGEDIIPAPEGECSGATTERPPVITGSETKTETGTGGETTLVVPGALGEVLEVNTTTPGSPAVENETAADGQPSVLGVSETSPGTTDEEVAAAAAPAVAETTDTRETKGLPFTGLELLLVVALGLATLLGGVALRRSLRNGQTIA